ncbi:MAG TPA: hypothetical protein VEA16_10975 [Vicinamibacterales bacterium]|nr:hypothetical protein [Vicinamibacterales bacterium]
MVGVVKKIALIGTAPTVKFAPWDDLSWSIWAHASAARLVKRCDRFFDQHPENCYREQRKNGFIDYFAWLKRQTTPIYMQEKVKEIPASVRYPKERIRAEFPYPVGSQGAWMLALALTEGVTHLGLFGVHYAHCTEYREQRANFEFWLGLAVGRGVQLVIPEGNPLLKEPELLYAYETHTPEQYAKRKEIALKAKQDAVKSSKPGLRTAMPGFDPSKLRVATSSEIPAPPPEIAAIWARERAEALEGVPI